VISGARIPNGGNNYEDINIISLDGIKKLELSRIAKTGNINDLL
jgi:hypothetical protein